MNSLMKTTPIKNLSMPFSSEDQFRADGNNNVPPPQGYWRFAWRSGNGANSLLFEQRAVAVNLGLFGALLLASVIYLSLGSVKVAPTAVLQALFGNADMMASFCGARATHAAFGRGR